MSARFGGGGASLLLLAACRPTHDAHAHTFSKNSTTDWTIAERDLPADRPLRWRIDSNVISDLKHVEFRVRAYNAEGFGAYAYTEPEHELLEHSMAERVLFWPLTALATFFLLLLASCGALYLAGERRASALLAHTKRPR